MRVGVKYFIRVTYTCTDKIKPDTVHSGSRTKDGLQKLKLYLNFARKNEFIV